MHNDGDIFARQIRYEHCAGIALCASSESTQKNGKLQLPAQFSANMFSVYNPFRELYTSQDAGINARK